MNISKKKNRPVPSVHGFQSDMTHDEWLKWRRSGIGGSDAGVALGLNPYKTPLDLYLDKVCGISDFTGNIATEWGNRLEEEVVKAAQDAHPGICRVIEDLPLMSHPDRSWQLATTDKGVVAGSKGFGGIEAKTALSFFSGAAYQGGKIPAHHRAQCVHYMAVTGAEFWILAALTEGPRFYTHVIERDDAEIQWLTEKEKRLWTALQEKDIEWMIDGSDASAKALLRLYPEPVERPAPAILTKQKILDAVEQYETSKAFEKAAAADKKEAENILKGAMGDHEEAIAGSATLTWKKTAKGRRFSVKKRK